MKKTKLSLYRLALVLFAAAFVFVLASQAAPAVRAESAPDEISQSDPKGEGDTADAPVLTTGESDPKGEGDAADAPVLTTGESAEDTDGAEDEDSVDKNSIVLSVIGAAISAVFVAIIFMSIFKKDKDGRRQRITTQQLTESALMIAIGTVCSMVKIDLPFGGGVTVASMLPLVLISHRYGWRWGVTTAFVYSLIQLALGLDNVGYATSTFMAFGVIFLDYIVAYTVIGLSGVFGKTRKAVATGIPVTFFLRFLCHYVTGVWIWKEWMPEKFMGMTMKSPWIYSGLYNGWYMLVELAVTLIIAMLIYKPLEKYFTNADAK